MLGEFKYGQHVFVDLFRKKFIFCHKQLDMKCVCFWLICFKTACGKATQDSKL